MSDAALISKVESYYDQFRAQELGLTRADFGEIVSDVIEHSLPAGDRRERARLLSNLRWEDLLLARACARGYEQAWAQFVVLYRRKLQDAALGITKEVSSARELADSLYADLFGTALKSNGERVCKLASYMGRGSVEGWFRTVLAQAYVDRFRSQRRFISIDEYVERPADTHAQAPGVHLPGSGEQAQMAQAVDGALANLDSEERFLLAAYYLDGRTLAQMGQLLRVHESTVSRRLEKVIGALRKQIIKNLARAGVSKQQAVQMLEVDVRSLEVDVRRGLRQERGAKTV